MATTITFNKLRQIKDSLPDGAIHQIATDLGMSVETVRDYFGGYNYRDGAPTGVHTEKGPDGGIVMIDDDSILRKAKQYIGNS